jgi:hypothetical protein
LLVTAVTVPAWSVGPSGLTGGRQFPGEANSFK